MSNGDKKLKSYLDRIMRLHEERKGLSDDISEIYKEAKSAGYDRKAMVNTVKRLMGDESAFAELDSLTDLYLRAYRGIGTPLATHARAPALGNEQHPELGAGDEGKGYAGRDEPAESMPEPNLGGAHPVADGPVATEPTVVAEADKAAEGESPSPIDDPLAIPAFLDRRGELAVRA